MVKHSHLQIRKRSQRLIAEAERKTCTNWFWSSPPPGDAYQSTMLLYGLIAAAQSAWSMDNKSRVFFPFLLALQIAAMGLLPLFRDCGIRACALSPNASCITVLRIRADEEYLTVSRHISAATPIVLIYISVAERYAHILTSRLVREKIPEETVERRYSGINAAISSEGLRNACIKAIRM